MNRKLSVAACSIVLAMLFLLPLAWGQTAFLVKDINPSNGGTFIVGPTAAGGTLFFAGDDGTAGRELWRSDGTDAGTFLVKDINPGPGDSEPLSLVAALGSLFMVADDGVHGREVWKSDGTTAGTVLLKDIAPNPDGAEPHDFLAVNGTLFLVASSIAQEEIWKTDGTEAGTVRVSDAAFASRLRNVGNTIFFMGCDLAAGCELWKTDGTEGGTLLVKDINPGTDGSFPAEPTAVGNTLFFTACTPTTGCELWMSDGTEIGTVLVKDIAPGNSLPRRLTNVAGTLFFFANDPLTGDEPWKSDGTEIGTTLVKDIAPGTDSSFSIDQGISAAVGATFFFRACEPATDFTDCELWKSDGTEAGTAQVADINPGSASSFPQMAAAGASLALVASKPETGAELWTSDGTDAGTRLLGDINPGPTHGVGAPPAVAAVGATLFFVADDGVHGRALWAAGIPKVTTQVVGPGGSVSTDAESDGATVTDPLEASLTTPSAGIVNVTVLPTETEPQGGFQLLGRQLVITAPAATAADPLVLTLLIDASIVATPDPETLQVFKEDTAVAECTGAPGEALPDPCESGRTLVGGNDLQIVVLTSTASIWTLSAPTCGTVPAPTCQPAAAGRATVTLVDGTNATRDRLAWSWTSSAPVGLGDFGAPTIGTDLALCVYDQQGLVLGTSMPAAGMCGDRSCWRGFSKGYRYASAAGTAGGVRTLRLQTGGAGRAKITAKAKGTNVGMPPLGLVAPVTIQIRRTDSDRCWSAVYSLNVQVNQPDVFRARSN